MVGQASRVSYLRNHGKFACLQATGARASQQCVLVFCLQLTCLSACEIVVRLFLLVAEQRARTAANESTNQRVLWWSFVEAAALVLVSLVQIFYIKKVLYTSQALLLALRIPLTQLRRSYLKQRALFNLSSTAESKRGGSHTCSAPIPRPRLGESRTRSNFSSVTCCTFLSYGLFSQHCQVMVFRFL